MRRGGGGDGSFGTAVLKMVDSCFSAAVYFSPNFGMSLDRAAFWRASVRSASALVTAYAGESFGVSAVLGRVPMCWILLMMLYWLCMM